MLPDRFCYDLVVMRNDFFEFGQPVFKMRQNPFCLFGACGGIVLGYQTFQQADILLSGHLRAFYQRFVQALVQVMVFVQHIRHAARHTGGKVIAGSAQNDNGAACHIFTPVFAHALGNGNRSGISYTEPFTGDSVDKCLTAGCAVQRNVADDDIILRPEAGAFGGIDNQLAAGQTFSEIVVAVAPQLQRQSLRDKGAEALTARAVADDLVGILLQGVAVSDGDFRAERRSQRSVCIFDIDFNGFCFARPQRLAEFFSKDFFINGLG